jgi:hypothetical protein
MTLAAGALQARHGIFMAGVISRGGTIPTSVSQSEWRGASVVGTTAGAGLGELATRRNGLDVAPAFRASHALKGWRKANAIVA